MFPKPLGLFSEAVLNKTQQDKSKMKELLFTRSEKNNTFIFSGHKDRCKCKEATFPMLQGLCKPQVKRPHCLDCEYCLQPYPPLVSLNGV